MQRGTKIIFWHLTQEQANEIWGLAVAAGCSHSALQSAPLGCCGIRICAPEIGYTGSDGGRTYHPDDSHYGILAGYITRMDGRTQMDQIREWFRQQSQPDWPGIVVVINGDEALLGELKNAAIEAGMRDSWVRRIPNVNVGGIGTVAFWASDTLGWNGIEERPEWYCDQVQYSGIHILHASTQMEEIKRWLMRDRNQAMTTPIKDESGTPITKFVIKVIDQKLGMEIQELALAAGYVWGGTPPGISRQQIIQQYISFGAYNDGASNYANRIFHDTYRSTFDTSCPTFDTNRHMEKIRELFKAIKDWASAASDRKLTAEEFVSQQLIQLIRSQPGAELVRGFIRRDHKVKLPEAVQAQGADAILKWLEENVKHPPTWPTLSPAQPPAQPGTRFEFTVMQQVSGTFTRLDRVRLVTVIPQSVIDEAREDGNEDIITEWIENETTWSELEEIDRAYGDDDTNQTDVTWDGLHDSVYSSARQFIQ
jgi:hypothetical protein